MELRDRKTGVAITLEEYAIPEPNTGCLLWLGAIQVAHRKQKPPFMTPLIRHRPGIVLQVARLILANRLRIGYEELTRFEVAILKCRTPACVDPDHIVRRIECPVDRFRPIFEANGLKYSTVARRLREGWAVARAITEPSRASVNIDRDGPY